MTHLQWWTTIKLISFISFKSSDSHKILCLQTDRQQSEQQVNRYPFCMIANNKYALEWNLIRNQAQEGPSWSWSDGSWIYNYLCNHN